MSDTETEHDDALEQELAEQLGDDDDQAAGAGDSDAGELGDEQARQTQQNERAQTEADIERATMALGKEAARHAKRVGEIMGDDAGNLVPCELCWQFAPGFRWPTVPDEETRERVKTALGMSDLSRYQEAADVSRCQTCNGLGRVKTGSEVNGQQTIDCQSCKGRGWTSPNPERALQVAGPPAPVTLIDEHTPAEPLPDLDPWGTPPDDPEYGKMPKYRTTEGQDRIAQRLAAAS